MERAVGEHQRELGVEVTIVITLLCVAVAVVALIVILTWKVKI